MTAIEKIKDTSKSTINKIISALLSPFFDADELFSWKKGMTAVVTFVFAYACVGYLNTHNFDVLPSKYVYLIVLIFVAYFGKDIPQGFIDMGSKYLDLKIEVQKNKTKELVNGDSK
jgi:hypothetical protein